MNSGLKSFCTATLIILFFASQAAGRGDEASRGREGESRGGERALSGRSREGESRGGEGGFFGRGGEGEYRGGERGVPGHGGEGFTNRSSDDRSPSFAPSHRNADDRPYPAFNPGAGEHTGPAPGPTPHPGPSPTPWLHPAPNPTPGPGPNPNPPHPAPNPNPGPGPRPNPNWNHGNWPNNGNNNYNGNHGWNNGWNNGGNHGWNNGGNYGGNYGGGNGWNNAPAAWGAGFATGVAAATPWAWGYWPQYNNPYCAAPVTVDDTTINYSQPIVLASPPATVVQPPPSAGAAANAGQPTPSDQAMERLDAARAAFAQGDYTAALSKCDQAVARLPNDAAAHQFRGLALFALQRYKDAAGTVYAVLSVGPGWDWATLSGFYPRADVYAEQLRALEQYVASNPNAAEARFLLAYHYMSGGHNDAAVEQFKAAVQLNPQDRLSAQLASATTPTAAGQPASTAAAAPARPIDAPALTGVWTSTRGDGTTITLRLAPDAKYTWKFVQKDKPQEFSGTYAVAENLLILKEGDSPAMVGQVTLLPDNRFNFKLAGNNPSDPGLTFGK